MHIFSKWTDKQQYMMKDTFRYNILICAITISLIPLFSIGTVILEKVRYHQHAVFVPVLTPWESIGGCGAGGSGSKNGSIRWIGEESGSGMIGIRVMPALNIKKLSRTFSVNPQLSIKPHWNYEIGVSLPWKSIAAEVQFQSNLEQQQFLNSGIGDLTVDCARTFGMNGEFKVHADLTFPTGIYDETRGTDQTKSILPQELQMGQGVWSVTPAFSYTHDLENSMIIFDASLNYPFMVRLDKKNEHLDADYRTYSNVTTNRDRFYYRHIVKPYGENDRGDYFPPVVNVETDFVFRGIPGITQSVQCTFSAPLGVRWVHSYNKFLYDPHPDPDNRAWEVLLGYGLEINRFSLPFYFGIGMPVRDKKNTIENTYDEKPLGRWDSPDWKSITEEMIITSGIKASLF